MATILNSLKYKSNCLISGKESEIEIRPGKNSSGIIFTSRKFGISFSATLNHVLDTTHATTLGKPPFVVKVAEHFMAALALARINDIEIIVDEDEMPIADGSSKTFYDLFQKAGIKKTTENRTFNISDSLFFNYEHTSISAIPSDNFRITYVVNYVNSPFSYSWYKWESGIDDPQDILYARTFGYLKDLPLYQSQGLALGVNPDNTVGLKDDGTFTTELRCHNEPIRHKILDLIGDLYLTGINPLDLKAHIVAIECGHMQHIELSKLLIKNISL
ncbi:MAG: UDP-3-O-acyl-N-acetylglucosamine deacetylase [Cyanobacteriota bacterium]